MRRGEDAAIFGSGVHWCRVLLLPPAEEIDEASRSHVARESAAFRLLLFHSSLFSFPPLSWLLRFGSHSADEEKDPIRSRKKFHSDAIILQPTKKRRFINAHFWLKNGDFSRRVCKSGED